MASRKGGERDSIADSFVRRSGRTKKGTYNNLSEATLFNIGMQLNEDLAMEATRRLRESHSSRRTRSSTNRLDHDDNDVDNDDPMDDNTGPVVSKRRISSPALRPSTRNLPSSGRSRRSTAAIVDIGNDDEEFDDEDAAGEEDISDDNSAKIGNLKEAIEKGTGSGKTGRRKTEIEKLRKSGGVDSDSMLDEIENGRALRQRRSTDFFARRTMPSASDGPAASGCVSRRIFPIDDDSNQSLPAKRQLAGTIEMSSGDSDVEARMERRYPRRQNRSTIARYSIALPDPRTRRQHANEWAIDRTTRNQEVAFNSPARKWRRRREGRKRPRDSSTSSSSEDSDRDKARFERRTAKSLERSRSKFLPVNMTSADALRGSVKDRLRANQGSSCTDIDPMALDRSVRFSSIGGLNLHILALKEMVLFPLLYPKIFSDFGISPPRGVLFYGPPGTGKTLVARALANECSCDGKKVSFFMRKGADCLSKWVGESERQLRLLFDQAFTMRPSIIFFDEIDGLAPIRSTRQDQIHSSIVSTLLALMDGLDSRGEVVVIGATNRLDSIDPALRRPGRFDREFPFTLPTRSARRQILKIHTDRWAAKPSDHLLDLIADKSVGYCGADIKGLCSEAVLIALRRKYPQIYTSEVKLAINVDQISVSESDFGSAMIRMVPAAKRGTEQLAKALGEENSLLFGDVVTSIMTSRLPRGYVSADASDISNAAQTPLQVGCAEVLALLRPTAPVSSARLVLCAPTADFGQTSHLAPAILHRLDHLPVYSLSIPSIFAASSHRSPEEAIAEILSNATRSGSGPSVLYIPAIDEWKSVVPLSTWHAFTSTIDSWDPTIPIFILATSHRSYADLDGDAKALFRRSELFEVTCPNDEQRRSYFNKLIVHRSSIEPEKQRVTFDLLPLAPPEKPRPLSAAELKALEKQEESLLRQMRIFLREILGRLMRDRRFKIFSEPVDAEAIPDYHRIITNPMDMSLMMHKIDTYEYCTIEQFLSDIDLIQCNALEYNPTKDEEGRMIRHRAGLLKDTAYALIDNELDPSFEKQLKEIKESRSRRVGEVDDDAQSRRPDLPLEAGVLKINRAKRTVQKRQRTQMSGTGPDPTDFSSMNPESLEVTYSGTTTIEGSDVPASCGSLAAIHKRNTSDISTKRKASANRRNIWCRPKKRRLHGSGSKSRRPGSQLQRTSAAIVEKYRKVQNATKTNTASSGRLSQNSTSCTGNVDFNQPNVKESIECNDRFEEGSMEVGVNLVSMEPRIDNGSPILPEPMVLLIDESRMSSIADKLTTKTVGWPTRKLTRVGAKIVDIISNYKEQWDRRPLADELQLFADGVRSDDF